jgi:hypothetical protein
MKLNIYTPFHSYFGLIMEPCHSAKRSGKTTSVEEKLYKGGDNAGPGGLSAASKVKRGKLDTEEKANNK